MEIPRETINVGDLVVIKEDNLTPNEWRLGRVIAVHPGADNRVRVVTLIAEKGEVNQPLVKLVLLPTNNEINE